MDNKIDSLCLKSQQEILLCKLIGKYEKLIEQTRDRYRKDNIKLFNVQQITHKTKFIIVLTHSIQEIRNFEVNLKFIKDEDLFKITIIAIKLSKDPSSQNQEIKQTDQQKELLTKKYPYDEIVSQQIQQNVPSLIKNDCKSKCQSLINNKNPRVCQENEKNSLEDQQVDTKYLKNDQTVEENLEQIVFENIIPVSSKVWANYFVVASDRKIEIQFSQNQKFV